MATTVSNQYHEMALKVRTEINNGNNSQALQHVMDAMSGPMVNYLKHLPNSCKSFDQEDFIQTVYLGYFDDLTGYMPIKIRLRAKSDDAQDKFLRIKDALAQNIITESQKEILENETKQINNRLDDTQFDMDAASSYIKDVLPTQYPWAASLEFNSYLSTIPAYFERHLRRALDQFTAEYKGISSNDLNRIRRRAAGVSHEKSAKTNFMLDQLSNRSADVPISIYEDDLSSHQVSCKTPEELTVQSAEDFFFNDIDSEYNTYLDAFMGKMHLKSIARNVKQKIILKHQLELLVSAPLEMALDFLQNEHYVVGAIERDTKERYYIEIEVTDCPDFNVMWRLFDEHGNKLDYDSIYAPDTTKKNVIKQTMEHVQYTNDLALRAHTMPIPDFLRDTMPESPAETSQPMAQPAIQIN